MSIIHSFEERIINSHTFSMNHLTPQRHIVIGHGHSGADITVRTSYHSHVFSTATKPTDSAYFWDENHIKRTFCPKRHARSFVLPQMCAEMIKQNHLTWISRDKNRISNLAVNGNQLNAGRHYVVFYYLFPSKANEIDVELVVKSAYEMYVDFRRIKRRFNTIQQIKTCYYKKKKVP